MNQHLSRRKFLHLSGSAALGTSLLAACQVPAAAPTQTGEEMGEAQLTAE